MYDIQLATRTKYPENETTVIGVNLYITPTEFLILEDALRYYADFKKNEEDRQVAKRLSEEFIKLLKDKQK